MPDLESMPVVLFHGAARAQVEIQASIADQVVTEVMLYATASGGESDHLQHAFGAGVKVHRILKISAVSTGDAAFSRQLRRKFL